MKTRKTAILAILFFFNPVISKAQTDIDSLLKVLPRLPDTEKISAFYTVGNNFYLRGMNDSALYYFTQSLNYAGKADSSKQVCEAYILIAKCDMHLDKLDEATEILFKSIAISEKKSLTGLTARAKYLVAVIYDSQSRSQDAHKLSLEAEKELARLKDTANLISIYPELLTSSAMNGDTVEAIRYFNKGLEVFEAYEKSTNISADEREHLPLIKMALIFNSINIFTKEKDLSAVLERIKRMDEQLKQTDNEYAKFEINTLIAVFNLRLKRFAEANKYAEIALTHISPEIGNDEQLSDVYQIISEASSALGQYEKAYHALDKVKNFQDSLHKASSLETIHSVEAKYETAKKDQAIITLHKQRKTQRVMIAGAIVGLLIASGFLVFAIRSKRLQKKLLIKEQEAQKVELEKKMTELEQTALRAQMNPHFIFNCLNSVQRFVNQNNINGVNLYLTTFANLIRQTLENSGKPFISLADELAYLETYIRVEQMRSQESFEYTIDVSPGIDSQEIYIPNMIIQPFVENSIRHGLTTVQNVKGQLRISVSKQGKLVFVVEDNGTGIKNKSQEKAAADSGHRSMGKSLTERRIELYNDLYAEKISLDIEDRSDRGKDESGTKVILQFPLSSI